MRREDLRDGELLRAIAVPAANIVTQAQALQQMVSADLAAHQAEILASLRAIEKQAELLKLRAVCRDRSCRTCMAGDVQSGFEQAVAALSI